MKKSIKPTVVLNKNNCERFLDLNSKTEFDKVMEVLNKLIAGNEYNK